MCLFVRMPLQMPYRDRHEERLEMHMIYYVMLIALFDDRSPYARNQITTKMDVSHHRNFKAMQGLEEEESKSKDEQKSATKNEKAEQAK